MNVARNETIPGKIARELEAGKVVGLAFGSTIVGYAVSRPRYWTRAAASNDLGHEWEIVERLPNGRVVSQGTRQHRKSAQRVAMLLQCEEWFGEEGF